MLQLRAVVVGLGIGCLLCFTNLYFGLQTGWISMWVFITCSLEAGVHVIYRMSLQSALLGYLISLLMPIPMTPQENVVLQTTATATGTVRGNARNFFLTRQLAHHDADAFSRGFCRNTTSTIHIRP